MPDELRSGKKNTWYPSQCWDHENRRIRDAIRDGSMGRTGRPLHSPQNGFCAEKLILSPHDPDKNADTFT